jgi:hypothetical protein
VGAVRGPERGYHRPEGLPPGSLHRDDFHCVYLWVGRVAVLTFGWQGVRIGPVAVWHGEWRWEP